MKIGELAQAAQCTVETVRYYEKEGLLPAASRTGSNYRSYGPEHAERLRFIRNCRALDMTHGEIRALLVLADTPGTDCGGINHLIDDHIGHVDARIQELLHLKTQLAELRQRCIGENALDECGILHGISEMTAEPKPAHRHTHLC
ncbi:Mercuric resistance operon regulatory protein [Andreprevotia sp. IGB-42]|uniref:Cd(II)/Pb(II)-responsive transcriptional regulator n=1 Tax=Andreprevotia sp. IGB-42 TaxID=2497473 RepID=UPI00135C2623|nr:Cd(II)/Pb(II)-responsive transcriptional regulator [Andreprevotia sp. IGB-42]KAF0813526.1 Mercuric resistance operon regulatory protein [Andreprevotia sp. IGB-42]